MNAAFHGILGTREICNHNLRFRFPSKSNICLICHCNKINDVLSTESDGKRKLSSANIREIIHQFRVLNSVLDVPIEANLLETLLSPVLQTSLAALKLHDDEVGTVVSQALEKISPKVPVCLLENFLKNLSTQILEKTSFSMLECLSVLFRQKECLNYFLTSHGSIVLPSLFRMVEKHVPQIILKCQSASSLANIRKPTTFENDFVVDCSAKESLRLVEKLFDIFDASCSSDVLLVANKSVSSKSGTFADSAARPFDIFKHHMKTIFGACMNLLSCLHSSEAVKFQFHLKILKFLENLYHQPETLYFVFSDRTGVAFCSTIKQLLYTHSIDVKVATLSLVNRILVTYKQAVDDSCTDKAIIVDLPSVISEVDLIHFITEAMNTSSENLFRMTLRVLDQINTFPLFRQGRMIPVLESTLRISTMRIPDNITDLKTYLLLNGFLLNVLTSLENIPSGIHRQLMYLFERLPKEWTASQFLPWIKLLIFCGREAELHGNLWNTFVSFVQRSKNVGSYYSVTPLKCVLLIAYSIMECQAPANDQIILQMLSFIMDEDFLPPLMALVSHGTSDDATYIVILLQLLNAYPIQLVEVDKTKTIDQYAFKNVKVGFDSPVTCELWTKPNSALYEIQVDLQPLFKVGDTMWYWSPKVLMQILGAMRLNSDLIANRQLFDLWNENMSKILSYCSIYHLPQLFTTLSTTHNPVEENDEEREITLQSTLKNLLGKLDIDVTLWSRILEKDNDVSRGNDVPKSNLQDTVLTFYFCYTLLAGSEVFQFLDSGFAKRLSEFLSTCVEQYNETQEIQEFGWTSISFYFRVGLIISSCLSNHNCMSDDVALLSKQFKLLWMEIVEVQKKFKYDVMVYRNDVFLFLFCENFFSDYGQLVEIWLQKDKNGCISFFTNKSVNEQRDLEITNCLLAVAAQGNKETSLLAVELACKRLKKFKIGFDFTFFMTNVHYLIQQISVEENSERSRNSINLSRLSNVMQLAVQDDFLFSPENHFPVDFLHQVVKIMLKFHDVSAIGRNTLALLSKILKDEITFKNASPELANYEDFIRFLGYRLHNIDKGNPEEFIFAHRLLTLLIRQKMQVEPAAKSCISGAPRPLITWKIASILSHIHDVPNVDILEFIATVFKVNFKCDLIQVKELHSPDVFSVTLLNLLFHFQALTHKVNVKAAKDAIWEILNEYLRLASERNEMVPYATFQSNVLFQPWMKVTVVHLLSQCNHVPSKLSLKPLEFLQKWTKLMLTNKLENPSKRPPILEEMVFRSYVDLFKTISVDMKKDRTQGTDKELVNSKGSSQCLTTPTEIFCIDNKTKLIGEIAKNCEIFLSTF